MFKKKKHKITNIFAQCKTPLLKFQSKTNAKKAQIIYKKYCKDLIGLESSTGIDLDPKNPNNKFVESGRKS